MLRNEESNLIDDADLEQKRCLDNASPLIVGGGSGATVGGVLGGYVGGYTYLGMTLGLEVAGKGFGVGLLGGGLLGCCCGDVSNNDKVMTVAIVGGAAVGSFLAPLPTAAVFSALNGTVVGNTAIAMFGLAGGGLVAGAVIGVAGAGALAACGLFSRKNNADQEEAFQEDMQQENSLSLQ